MYEGQNYEIVKNRILGNIPDNWSKIEGTFIHDLSAALAVEESVIYENLDKILAFAFAQTTSGIYLELKVAEKGLIRKTATKAIGNIVINGNEGSEVESGSLFTTKAGIQFITTQSVVIGSNGSVIAPIEAVEAGISGKVSASSITVIPVTISGVYSVNNTESTTGGTDLESDDDLLNRFLEYVRNPPRSGNEAHYIFWAKSVNGVGLARCISVWNGGGTVKVVIIDSERLPAAQSVINDVASYIQEQRPLGADVTVVSADALNVDISAKLILKSGYSLSTVKSNIEAQIVKYLKEIAFIQDYVSYAKIGGIILEATGVYDYQNLKINNGIVNISISNTQVAVKGVVDFNE